jgi:hypothetical protein
MNTALRHRPEFALATMAAAVAWQRFEVPEGSKYHASKVWCDAAATPPRPMERPMVDFTSPSWLRRNLLAPIGVPLPTPRVLTSTDPALKLRRRCIQRRQRDEVRMRQLLEAAPTLRGDPEKLKKLGNKMFEVTYGKGVTPQAREDFLLQYGCTGWTEEVLKTIVELCDSRGVVEMGAGHGQWARALSKAYDTRQVKELHENQPRKRFDFVLAYDDMSNLPLNTHIYNPYTQPHHDYFGNVRKLETKNDLLKVLRSWACRGRVLLMVYPPPGDMAKEAVQTYVDAAPDNDTVIFVGEGRGGANGDDALFDYFESGDWVLLKVMEVQPPPGDTGYEKLFILQRKDEAKHTTD